MVRISTANDAEDTTAIKSNDKYILWDLHEKTRLITIFTHMVWKLNKTSFEMNSTEVWSINIDWKCSQLCEGDTRKPR